LPAIISNIVHGVGRVAQRRGLDLPAAGFDLGEAHKVVIVSVTEGEDKPLKYPTIFNSADVAVITKNELSSAVEFDWDAARTSIQSVRPGMQIFRLSAKTGEGMEEYLAFLAQQLAAQKAETRA